LADFTPQDPDFEARVRRSFAKQDFMATLGAEVLHVAPGAVTLELPFQEKLTQQHGFLHAGALTSVLDSACGYAALTLMPVDAAVLTIEFKTNLLSPAVGVRFTAEATVKRAGRTIMVCTADAVAHSEDGKRKVVATMVGTMMVVQNPTLSD